MDDDVSIDELQRHLEGMFRCYSKYIETDEVHETHEGATVWAGAVKVFHVSGHASGAKRAYAWSHATEGGKRRFVAVLGVPPIDSAVMAVRASILANEKKKEN